MKKLIIFPLLIVAIGAFGQKAKIKSTLGDSIYVPSVSALQSVPVVIVNLSRDTIRSILWNTTSIQQDAKFSTNIIVVGYDRNANAIISKAIVIQPTTVAAWTTLQGLITTAVKQAIPGANLP